MPQESWWWQTRIVLDESNRRGKRKMRSAISESALLADQLRRAFEGSAWHGPAVLELLQGMNASEAAAKPLPNAHSIWELLLHVAAWDNAALRRLKGDKFQPEGTANSTCPKASNRNRMA